MWKSCMVYVIQKKKLFTIEQVAENRFFLIIKKSQEMKKKN